MRLIAAAFLMGPSFAVADPFYLDIPADQDVIILGENHDNPQHHLNQAQAIAALQPAAVVFEMLNPAEAELIFWPADRKAVDIADQVNWEASGWPPFEDYQPVFEALGEAWVYGAEVERDAMSEVFETSAVAVFEAGFAARYGPPAASYGLDRALAPDEQAERERGQQAAHCGMLPPEMLPGFVDAQRLRDTALAWAILRAHEETQGLVVVITGNGHARTDWGLPAVLAVAAPELEVFSVGQVEAEEDGMPFDLVLRTDPIQRPDPCAGFQN